MNVAGESEQAAADRLAEKLNRLFATVVPKGRGPYSNREVERWLADHSEDGAPTVSANYLSLLRRAERTNPTSNSLRAIARFFEVDAGYLLTDNEWTRRIDAQLDALSMLANANVRGIATRASGLDSQSQSWVLQMLETLPQARHSPGDETAGPGDVRPNSGEPGAGRAGDGDSEGRLEDE